MLTFYLKKKQQHHPSELFNKSAATQQLLFCTPKQNRSLISAPKVKHTWFLSKIFPKNQVTGTRCEIEHPQTTCWVLGGKPMSKKNQSSATSPAQNRRTKASTSYFFFGSVNSKALFASPPNHFPGSSAHRWLSCHKNLRKNTRNNSIFKHGSISSEHKWWVPVKTNTILKYSIISICCAAISPAFRPLESPHGTIPPLLLVATPQPLAPTALPPHLEAAGWQLSQPGS